VDKKLVVATFYAKPDSKEVLREWILKTATASRKELGVEKYLINVIDEALGHFLLVGLYSSDDAFNDHVNSVHVQNFLSAVPDLVEDNITYIATPFVNSTDPKSIIESN
jgi:quinol monooxygenase YgiN